MSTDRCCVCGSPDVVYYNYLDKPLCCPCAECCPPKREERVTMEYETSLDEANTLALKRRLVWDLFPHGEEIADDFARLGLSLGSDEVQELEHRDSHDRMRPVTYLTPGIEHIGGITSEILTDFILSTHPDAPPEAADVLGQTYNALILSSAGVIIAHLISSGMLKLGWKE